MGCLARSDAPSAHVGALCQTNASAKRQSTRRSTRRPALSWASRPPLPPQPNRLSPPPPPFPRPPPSADARASGRSSRPTHLCLPRTVLGGAGHQRAKGARRQVAGAAGPLCEGAARPCPHLHRDWARRCHMCAGTGLTPATSAPGLGSPLPHLRRPGGRTRTHTFGPSVATLERSVGDSAATPTERESVQRAERRRASAGCAIRCMRCVAHRPGRWTHGTGRAVTDGMSHIYISIYIYI